MIIKWTLEKKVFAGFALALMVLAGVGTLSFQTTGNLINNEKWVAHTNIVLTEIEGANTSVQNLLQGARFSERSFLTTGEDGYLAPTKAAFSSLHAHVAMLRQLTADNPAQQSRIVALDATISNREDIFNRVVELRKSSGFNSANQLETSLSDTQALDAQKILTAMKDEETTLLQQRAVASEASAHNTTLVFAFAICSVLLFLSVGFYRIRRDVTDRLRIEEALQKQTDLYQSMLQAQSDLGEGVMVIKGDKVAYMNDAFCELTGYTPEELPDVTSLMKIIPSDRTELTEDWLAKRNSGQDVGEPFEGVIVNRDGRHIPVASAVKVLELEGTIGRLSITRDITARKEAEEALRESETRFRRLSEASREGIAIHNDGKIIEANSVLAEMVGYTVEELIGMDILALTTPASQEIALKKVREGNEDPYEIYGLRKDRSLFPMEILGKSMPLEGHTVRVSTIRDLTERKEAEEALRQSESEYRGLFENAHDALVILTPGTETVLDANAAACKLYGFSHDEFVGKSLLSLSKGPDCTESPSPGIVEQGGTTKFETVQFRSDGKELALEVTAAIVDYKGQRAFLSINRDISERKRAEEAIRASEKKYRLLMDQASDGVVVVDRAGNYIEANMKACNALGYTREELLSLNVTQVIAPEDLARMSLVEDRLAARKGMLIEHVLLRKDGSRFPVEVSVKLLDDGTMQAIIRDITERKRAQEALHKLATRDALTGLYNRHEMDRLLHEEVSRCRRYNRPLSVIMVDIDHFKEINDKYGHHTGDKVLRWIGGLFRDNVRDVDWAARYGGEEIAIILPETCERDATLVAERFRHMMGDHPFAISLPDGVELRIPVTISVGVAEFPADAVTEESLLMAADQALYRAKRAGRNRVMSYNMCRITTTGQLLTK